MADISKIKIGSLIYDIKDKLARTVMKGAGANAAGEAGQVPAPPAGAANRYLRSDGTWQTPPDTNTTYGNMAGANTSAAGKAGLVPAPPAGAANRYLRSDGTWQTPPDTNTVYTHPTTHPASMISQDSTHRFVTDNEKSAWNGKAGTGTASQSANGLMSANDKKKLDGIANNANNFTYSHPGSHPASMITQDASHRFVSDSEKNNWNGKANGSHSHNASNITQDGTHRFVTDSEKATWNATARMIYTGWGKSITVPLGRGIHGIILDDWRWVFGVCVQGNAGSRAAHIEYANEYWNTDMEEPDITVSYNNTTNVMTVTRKDGGNNSLIYIGL